jgi:hypothetical protein
VVWVWRQRGAVRTEKARSGLVGRAAGCEKRRRRDIDTGVVDVVQQIWVDPAVSRARARARRGGEVRQRSILVVVSLGSMLIGDGDGHGLMMEAAVKNCSAARWRQQQRGG